jgi:hypothetical protein
MERGMEREKKGWRERKRDGERERGMEREKEGWRERKREYLFLKGMMGDGCLGTF